MVVIGRRGEKKEKEEEDEDMRQELRQVVLAVFKVIRAALSVPHSCKGLLKIPGGPTTLVYAEKNVFAYINTEMSFTKF